MSSLQGKKILVADDEPMLREIIRDVLEFEGAQVREAANGKEALALIQADPVQAVVSDIRMPGGDGLELLENLRKADFATPVVLLITGFSDLSHDSAYQKGADAVLSKPFDVNELIDRIQFLLKGLKDRLASPPSKASRAEIGDASVTGVALGRSGMFVQGYADSSVGDQVGVDLGCELESRLNGAAVVRWVRKTVQGELPPGSGLEFVYLKDASLKQFEDHVKHHPTRASIPDRS